MSFRPGLIAPLLLLYGQGIVSASTTYNVNGNFDSNIASNHNYSIYPGTGTAITGWTENPTNTGEQIDCIVAVANTSKICGNPGPGNAMSISMNSAPGGTLPNGIVNYLEVDGNPQYGGPVSTNLTGLTVGNSYLLTFYQSSNEENTYNTASNDNWKVYLINGSNNGTGNPTNPVFTSPVMANPGGTSTPWNLVSYTFIATAASETLEFLANASVANVPPFLGLAAVNVTDAAVPEPGTWAMMAVGAGAMFGLRTLLRRSRR